MCAFCLKGSLEQALLCLCQMRLGIDSLFLLGLSIINIGFKPNAPPAYSCRTWPCTVVVQAAGSPTLINLLRALSYQKRMLAEAALSAAAQDSLQATVDDLSETLRTVLCL